MYPQKRIILCEPIIFQRKAPVIVRSEAVFYTDEMVCDLPPKRWEILHEGASHPHELIHPNEVVTQRSVSEHNVVGKEGLDTLEISRVPRLALGVGHSLDR